eukprot:gene4700-3393_t
MERAAAARREIFDLWATVGAWEEQQEDPLATLTEAGGEPQRRYQALLELLNKYELDVTTPAEADVSRWIGDALDRLVLLCVPLPPGGPTDLLERVLLLAGRQGRQLSVRLVQHLFARTSTYTEALIVFHTLRRANVAMNMQTYHAMLYSLQRLEEEGWAKRFRDEYLQRGTGTTRTAEGVEGSSSSATEEEDGGVSEQALEFILRGTQSPLLPENKPWLGRIMYENGAGGSREDDEEAALGLGALTSSAAATRQTTQSWDQLGALWLQRYRRGDAPHNKIQVCVWGMSCMWNGLFILKRIREDATSTLIHSSCIGRWVRPSTLYLLYISPPIPALYAVLRASLLYLVSVFGFYLFISSFPFSPRSLVSLPSREAPRGDMRTARPSKKADATTAAAGSNRSSSRSSSDLVQRLQRENNDLRSKWLAAEEARQALEAALEAAAVQHEAVVEQWKRRSRALAERLAAEVFSPPSAPAGGSAAPTPAVPSERESHSRGTDSVFTGGRPYGGGLGGQDQPPPPGGAGWGRCVEEVQFLLRAQQEERAFAVDILEAILADMDAGAEGADALDRRGCGVGDETASEEVSRGRVCELLTDLSLGVRSRSAAWTLRLAKWSEQLAAHTAAAEEMVETLVDGPLRVLFERQGEVLQGCKPQSLSSYAAATTTGSRQGTSSARRPMSDYTASPYLHHTSQEQRATDGRPLSQTGWTIRGGPTASNSHSMNNNTSSREKAVAGKGPDQELMWACDVLKACVRGVQGLGSALCDLRTEIASQPALLAGDPPESTRSRGDRLAASRPTQEGVKSSSATVQSGDGDVESALYQRLSRELYALEARSMSLQHRLLLRLRREESARLEAASSQALRLQRLATENRRLAALLDVKSSTASGNAADPLATHHLPGREKGTSSPSSSSPSFHSTARRMSATPATRLQSTPEKMKIPLRAVDSNRLPSHDTKKAAPESIIQQADEGGGRLWDRTGSLTSSRSSSSSYRGKARRSRSSSPVSDAEASWYSAYEATPPRPTGDYHHRHQRSTMGTAVELSRTRLSRDATPGGRTSSIQFKRAVELKVRENTNTSPAAQGRVPHRHSSHRRVVRGPDVYTHRDDDAEADEDPKTETFRDEAHPFRPRHDDRHRYHRVPHYGEEEERQRHYTTHRVGGKATRQDPAARTPHVSPPATARMNGAAYERRVALFLYVYAHAIVVPTESLQMWEIPIPTGRRSPSEVGFSLLTRLTAEHALLLLLIPTGVTAALWRTNCLSPRKRGRGRSLDPLPIFISDFFFFVISALLLSLLPAADEDVVTGWIAGGVVLIVTLLRLFGPPLYPAVKRKEVCKSKMLHTNDKMQIRRRGTVGSGPTPPTVEVALPPMAAKEEEAIREAAAKRIQRKEAKMGALAFFIFIALALGIPGYLIYINTPFFAFQNVRCRLLDRFMMTEAAVKASEAAYESFFHNPPLYGSEAYQRVMLWGTYDPSKIFALKTATATPATVGIAWYDAAGRFPVRHTTALLHNRVASLKSHKKDAEEDTMRVEWAVHDGHHYGRLMITDYPLRLQLEVEFLKAPGGEGWHARVHGTLEPSTTSSSGETIPNDLQLVVYLLNDNNAEDVEVLQPQEGLLSSSLLQSFSPTLTTRIENHVMEKERVFLHVEDDHSPFAVTHPWRLVQLHTAPGDLSLPARHPTAAEAQSPVAYAVLPPFAFDTEDTFGGRVRERVATEGKTRTLLPDGGARRLYESPALNLREVSCLSSRRVGGHGNAAEEEEAELAAMKAHGGHYCVADVEALEALENAARGGQRVGRNMVVLKRRYSGDFRVELSLTTATADANQRENIEQTLASLGAKEAVGERRKENPDTPSMGNYKRLSVCQATNSFRRRQKRIAAHHMNMFKSWVKHIDKGREGLYQRVASMALSELLGSMSYTQGSYLLAAGTPSDAAGAAGALTVVKHPAGVFGFLGSRTDEPFIRMDVSGMQLLFLVRFNKEVAKSVLHSWLVSSQDPATGFIPSRAGLNTYTRSLMPKEFRVEDPNVGAPPALLLGLKELLQEMERKQARVLRHRRERPKSSRKPRNSDEYLEREGREDRQFLRELLPALRRWRQWWHTSQCGGATDHLAQECQQQRRPLEEWPARPRPGHPEDLLGYRWRTYPGESSSSSSSSGMEDYPRATCAAQPHRDLHVDLFSWVALLSQLISRIETHFLGMEESVRVDWEAHLDALHWDETSQMFADRGGCVPEASSSALLPPFSPYVGFVNLAPVALGVVRRNTTHILSSMSLGRTRLSEATRGGIQSLAFSSVRRMRENGLKHFNAYTGSVWPWQNALYAYALKTVYGNNAMQHQLGGPDTEEEAVRTVQRVAEREYARIRTAMLPSLLHVARWWECYNPVTGEGLGGKTYIGSRALLLTLLYDFE